MSTGTGNERPIAWSDENPATKPANGAAGEAANRAGWRADDDAKRIAVRRERQAADDRASIIRGGSLRE